MQKIKDYVTVLPLFFITLAAHGMEENGKNKVKAWEKQVVLFGELATTPAKNFRIEGSPKGLPEDLHKFLTNKEQTRASLVSFIGALRKEGDYIVLDLSKIKTPILETLVGNFYFPETIKPETINFIDLNLKPQEDANTFGEQVTQAITIHNQKPQSPSITVDCSKLKALFETPLPIVKIVPQKPTLLQRLTDPVTLCATGAGMGITALCFWLMMQQEAE